MSIPPLRRPSDLAKYRAAHLSSLALSASNDQLNLNAGKMFAQKGASSLASDKITPAERSAGAEGNKQLVRAFLSGERICDSYAANEAVGSMTSDEVGFCLQMMKYISNDFKPRGIPAQVFIRYLRKLRQKQVQTEGVEFNLQQDTFLLTAAAPFMSPEQQAEVHAAIQAANLTDTVRRKLLENIKVLEGMNLSQAEVQNLGIDAGEAAQIIAPALEERPSPVDLLDALHDDDGIRAIELTTPSAEALHAQADVQEFIARHVPTATPINETGFEAEAFIPTQIAATQMGRVLEPDSLIPEGMEGYVVAFDNDTTGGMRSRIRKTYRATSQYPGGPVATDSDIDAMNPSELRPFYLALLSFLHAVQNPLPPIPTHTARTLVEARQEKGVGSGLYSPLGRHKINHHKLREGILQVKYPSGSGIQALPTQKISRALGEMVMKLVANHVPSIREFEGLSPADKDLLYSLVHHAKIDLDVPTQETDRDLERFSIVKGEICSGNDSPQLVKELKALLIRFGKNGRIPRRQVNELLETLLDFGH